MTIFFDMDGTIADLYGVEGWRGMLKAADTTPYEIASPMLRFSTLAYMLNRLKHRGYRLGIISWTSKNGTKEYHIRVADAKREWLKKHLPSVEWDEINIVPYGFEKHQFAKSSSDILFDDNQEIRNSWTGMAFDVSNILGVLKTL